MNRSEKIFATAAVASILALGNVAAGQAGELASVLSVKPLHGVSFNVGSKHAVAYYSRDAEMCNLVLTLAEAPDWDAGASLTSTRFEAAIPARKATRFESSEGQRLEFACQASAESMNVRPVEQVAISTAR